jgi:CubicO group peptidase (beta-lactamase class C family)
LPLSRLCKLALAAVTGLALIGPAAAQEAAPAPSPTTSNALPSAPIPYTTIRPQRQRPAARRATTTARRAAGAAVARPGLPAGPAPFTPLAAAAPMPTPQLEAFIDGYVRQAMASDHVPGVTISVVQNGQLVLKKGYGLTGINPARPVDPDRTLFRIGSISKTFTWISVMKEIEAGRMRLDAPVNLYLPQKVQVRDQGYDKPVTLRHLMTHTAGFEDRALGQLFERDPERVRPLLLYLRQERPRRVREPGSVPSYSNYGAALAGAAVSTVTGKTFEALAEQDVINPLGLTRTTFREPYPPTNGLPRPMNPALARDLAQGLQWTPGGYRRHGLEYMSQIAPAGSASSTAADMARYMTLLLNGGTIDGSSVFSPNMARWMRTSLYRPAAGAAAWNYGFQEELLPGGRRGFGHAGNTPLFQSNMVLVPELGLGIFISTNGPTGADLANQLPGAVVENFYGPRTVGLPSGSSALARQASVYEGAYLTSRRAYGGMEGFVGALGGFVKVEATPTGYLSIKGINGARLWAPTGQAGVFRSVDGPQVIAFEVKDGRATRFFGAGSGATFERRGPFGGLGLLGTLAVLTAIASLAALIGTAFRNRRDFRQTTVQARASLMQNTQAVLWLIAFAAFALWAGSGDISEAIYSWPGPWIVLASACALVAAVLTVVTLAMLPVIWRGGRRVDSWTPWRKLRFTLTVLVFTAFAADLGYWGALTPWSG